MLGLLPSDMVGKERWPVQTVVIGQTGKPNIKQELSLFLTPFVVPL